MYTPKFTLTPKLTNWIAQIEAVKQKIDRSNILPEKEIALRYRAAIESAHSSTSIEGNPLNEKQVKAALAGKLNAWEKRVIEVVNYKKAWDWILKRNKRQSKITIRDILKLHALVADQLLPENKIGKLRPGPIYIVDIIDGKDVVRYTGPEASEVKSLLVELSDWLNKEKNTLHPVLVAGILHYEFVSIHPFSDGNGRVTRLLVKLLLDLLNYDFRGCLVLDTYYWQNTNRYYQNLNQAKKYRDQTKIDLTNWLSYFIEGFYLVAKDLERKIEVVGITGQEQTIRLNDNEMQILEFTQQFGQISLKDVLEILQVPERTAQRRLKNLVIKDLLKAEGRGKNTHYILKKRLK
ncbi:MAG: hypothetical protein A3A58_02980 [Candidatus Blackburnbacteria bacterium RIFCSPLOWO2_01_FULL_41_27]|uniref:Fido domain-containing protein n=2 Tax=Candidatus Blackburniibacteriota TaxID=1817898 RepID=A0A1G1V6B1_9BACT|nr:MAG: hypothetical protein A3F61_01900 [Candidatus Blackburnbacteria bacterium RIFCSPHIGHO2_12_FULL_41_13b]OGY12897.1 MAG: hypothetical protein A3A58_02980 [Candidatus Blackburnbacteria bacterium RIFCSPLOWO2_01_FULL_41_27]